jgi:hypothetical protein
LKECEQKCYRDNPDPLFTYNKKHTTPNGWYINTDYFWGGTSSHTIKNISLDIGINQYNPLYKNYLEILDELPDPRKIYITDEMVKNHEWKLTYNPQVEQLEWENQKDKMKQQFVIASPLNIGDQMAKERT